MFNFIKKNNYNKEKDINNIKKEDLKLIRKKILNMIIPIAGENILQMSMGLISMAMIGHIGELAIGAAGLGTRISSIIWALFKGIATGATVLVAQAYGAQDNKKLVRVIKQSLLSSFILTILAQQYIYWNSSVILIKFFNPSKELLKEATLFLKVISFGLPFLTILLIVIGVLQGMGNAKTPFFITFIMNIFNILLSFIFIFGNLGMPALGIKGAAIATVISQIIGASIALYVLFNKNGVLNSKLNLDLFKLDFKEVTTIYKLGLPSSMESVFWQFAAIILTRIMLKYSSTVLAAYQLGLQAESISYTPAIGFGIAATTFIGQSIGAKEREKGETYLREIMKGSMAFTLLTVVLLMFFPKALLYLLTNDRNVINIAAKYLIIMGLVQIPQNASGVLNGALRGAGYTKVPMIVSAVGLWGFRIPVSLLLAYVFKLDVVYVWIAMGIDLVIRFILSSILYKSKKIYKDDTLVK